MLCVHLGWMEMSSLYTFCLTRFLMLRPLLFLLPKRPTSAILLLRIIAKRALHNSKGDYTMTTSEAVSTSLKKQDIDLAHTMYAQLHSEITARIEMRQGIITFTLLVAASLFSLGLQGWANAITILSYPILALFLSLIWAQHDAKIGQMATFCRVLEERLLEDFGPGWEQWRRQQFSSKGLLIEIPAKGVFLASELLAIIIGIARFIEQDSSLATL